MSSDPNHYKPTDEGISFVPLGGCGQFGANFSLYGYDGAWIAIDCGMAFADDRMPGIDILLPDPSFIANQKDRLKALVITHAHEDHVGAVARLWPRLQCPIYASRFAAAVLARKFAEYPPEDGSKPVIVEFTDSIHVDPFSIECIPVAHSIPEAFSLAIECKDIGTVLHSGDWNLDPAPVIGKPTPEDKFKAIGDKGILAYVGDSTNAPVEGFSKSESEIGPAFEIIFKECKGRVAVTLFSSNIARVISIYKAAKACGRSVCLSGRSLQNMVENARECGYIPDEMRFISEDDAQNLTASQVVYIVTGSQGEGRAALAKIARGMHPRIKLHRGDTVIFSARSIPGNERSINDIKNLLVSSHIQIIDPDIAGHTIHVSGHPRQGEIKTMLDWVRPKSLIAVHGERIQQEAQSMLHDNSVIPENGQILLIRSDGSVQTKGFVETNLMAVDFDRIVDLDHSAVGERRKISFNGAVLVSLVYDTVDDDILDLQATTLGLLDMGLAQDRKHFEELENAIGNAIDKLSKKDRKDFDALSDKIGAAAKRYFRDLFDVRPIVETHITLLD